MKHVRTFKPLSFASPVAAAAVVALGALAALGATGASSHTHNAEVRANAHHSADAAAGLAIPAQKLPPLIFGRASAAGAVSDRDAPGDAILTAFGRDARVDFHAGGVTILQVEPRPADAAAGGPALKGLPVRFDAVGAMVERPLPESARPNWRRVEVSFAGDDEHGGRGVVPVGEDQQATIVSIFKGREPQWRTGLPTFAAVRYPSAWPGVDVVFAANGDGLVARIEARPGADASAARLAVRCVGPCPSAGRGVAGLVAGSMGSAGSVGQQRLSPGRAELQLGPERRPGPSWSSARPGGEADDIDVVSSDPGAVIYAGFWGFPGDDRGLGLAVGRDGAAYVTGHTFAENPGDSQDDIDAFMVKVRPDGTALDYVSILGGDGYDTSFDVAVDAAGNAYFVGTTGSGDDTRPAKGGPDLTFNGSADAFVGKLNPAGDGLVFCGVLGGLYYDMAEGVAIDAQDHAYVTGMTLSSASSFPVKGGPDLTFNGKADAFIAKLEVDQTGPKVLDNLVYAGYIGGNQHDAYVYDRPDGSYVSSGQMAVDAEGAAYISGQTLSTEDTFPDGDGFGDVPGADQTNAGTWEAWIAKVRSDGAGLAYATFWGGAGEDLAFGMDVDASGAAYFAGWTDSKEDTLHPVVGPDLTFNGESDALAGKLTPDGRAFEYLGYIGGANGDAGMGARVDAHGRLAVIGYTESSEETLPVVLGPDLTYNGHEANKGDALVVVVAADPTAADPRDNFVLAGYIGGTEWDEAFWPTFGPDGSLYVVGDTNSGPDTFPDGGGLAGRTSPHAVAAGGSDAFVVKIAVPEAGEAGTPRPRLTVAPTRAAPTRVAPTTAPTTEPTARPTAIPTSAATPVGGRRVYLPWGSR